jgi:hemoglobin
VSEQTPTPFERLGGPDGVRKLVDRFYDLMSELPEARDVLHMHPQDLHSSREKLRLFLTGWLGGPPLYVQRYGHPRLRMRHLPFAIDDAARDAWMRCMRQALDEQVADELLREMLRGAFQRMADHMRNTGLHSRPEDEASGV